MVNTNDEDEDGMYKILEEEGGELEFISVINLNTDDSPTEVNMEYVLIMDEAGEVIYKDEDYKS